MRAREQRIAKLELKVKELALNAEIARRKADKDKEMAEYIENLF